MLEYDAMFLFCQIWRNGTDKRFVFYPIKELLYVLQQWFINREALGDDGSELQEFVATAVNFDLKTTMLSNI